MTMPTLASRILYAGPVTARLVYSTLHMFSGLGVWANDVFLTLIQNSAVEKKSPPPSHAQYNTNNGQCDLFKATV